MKVSLLVAKIFGRSLTCSEVMDLMMDQPTRAAPDGSVESHAHFHTMDGFTVNPAVFVGNDFSLERKRFHWENPSHLYPTGADQYDSGRWVYERGTTAETLAIYSRHYGGAFQDPDRIAPNRTYVNRTGLGELPQVTRTTYTVQRSTGHGPPVAEVFNTRGEVDALPVGRTPGHYLPQRSNDPHSPIRVQERTVVVTPRAVASPAHTMFPDTESMIMHLTASLMSDAGKMAVRHLFMDKQPGQQVTVGIFSKAAVRAVTQADTGIANIMKVRRLEVNQMAPRDPVTGLYPATGRVLTDEMAIDHIVTVLGYRATGDLNVITCFPSSKTTLDSIGTGTGPLEDIAELEFTHHTRVTQTNPLPTLRW